MWLGLIGYWHRAICGYGSRAIIPYDQRLSRLAAYFQQLDMESNGKSVTVDGKPVSGPTGPVVWGEPGTNGQHAFFQLLHQGTDTIPLEFIVAAKGHEPALDNQHEMLLANCLAQSEALMKGRTLDEARAQLQAKKMPETDVERIAPHRVFSGNRPSLTLVHDMLDPYALGRLVALYEHRVFVEAQIFGINAFDQWGVELGKELCDRIAAGGFRQGIGWRSRRLDARSCRASARTTQSLTPLSIGIEMMWSRVRPGSIRIKMKWDEK